MDNIVNCEQDKKRGERLRFTKLIKISWKKTTENDIVILHFSVFVISCDNSVF